jgi:hypothetical protein
MRKTVYALATLAVFGFSDACIASTMSNTEAPATSSSGKIVLAQSTNNNGANGGGTGFGAGHGQNKGRGATKNNANGRF